jgi:hypothetical protein
MPKECLLRPARKPSKCEVIRGRLVMQALQYDGGGDRCWRVGERSRPNFLPHSSCHFQHNTLPSSGLDCIGDHRQECRACGSLWAVPIVE